MSSFSEKTEDFNNLAKKVFWQAIATGLDLQAAKQKVIKTLKDAFHLDTHQIFTSLEALPQNSRELSAAYAQRESLLPLAENLFRNKLKETSMNLDDDIKNTILELEDGGFSKEEIISTISEVFGLEIGEATEAYMDMNSAANMATANKIQDATSGDIQTEYEDLEMEGFPEEEIISKLAARHGLTRRQILMMLECEVKAKFNKLKEAFGNSSTKNFHPGIDDAAWQEINSQENEAFENADIDDDVCKECGTPYRKWLELNDGSYECPGCGNSYGGDEDFEDDDDTPASSPV